MFPNSKDGTLAADEDLAAKVEEFQKGKTEIRSDKNGNIHALLGKTSFSLEQLEKNYHELEKMHQELKTTQTQLLQSSNLISIGQLAAGIAHEINTPIQYIANNTRFLQASFQVRFIA